MRRRWLADVAFALAALFILGCGRKAADTEEEKIATVVSVKVAPIVRATLREYVVAWGTVEPQPPTDHSGAASARVAAPVAGLLAQVRAAEGQRVQEGMSLFVLDTRVTDGAVAKARQALQFAEGVFERQKDLGPGEATSQRQYKEAEQNLAAARNDLATAETQRGMLDVKAPLSGTVVKVNARPGDAVDPTTVLAEVIDLDRLVVTVPVRSSEAGRVRRGQAVLLTPRDAAPTMKTEGVQGWVVFVGDAVDSKTDTVPVRASVPPRAGLRPGQFLDVQIVIVELKDRLAAPVEGLVTEDGETTLAVVDGERAVKRPVKAGLRDGPLVEVEAEGLREGQSVVAAGAYGLPKETRVKVVER